MAVDDCRFILQKIAGEGGAADDVGAGIVEHHIWNVGNACLYQFLPHGKGHQGCVLAEDEQVENIAIPGGCLHKILMAQCEGIGVHDERGGNTRSFCFFQMIQIVWKAAFSVLHEHQCAVHPGNLIKAQTAKKLGRIYLGVQEQVEISSRLLHLHQVGDNLIEQPLAPMLGADGEAPQGRAKAAARGNDFVICVPHGADVVQMGVPGDALILQQRVNLGKASFVRGIDLGNGVLTHGVPPSENAAGRSGPADRRCRRETGCPE